MTEQIQPELQALIDAFHLMWDHFPEPVQLANKKYEVVAVNPACALMGRVPGMVCIKHGPPEAHKGCLAQQAIKEHQAKYVRNDSAGKEKLIYWLPIDGYPDHYIHFGTRTLVNYE